MPGDGTRPAADRESAADAPPGVHIGDGDLRDELALLGADVVRAGLVVGSGGNLSAREPGADTCWVTVTGAWLDRLDRRHFVRVRVTDGTVVGPGVPGAGHAGTGPSGPRPTSELALHLHTYRARPDVNAVVHLHPQTVLLLDALGEPVRLVTTDHAAYLRPLARVGPLPPGSTALAEQAAAAAAAGANCVVLAHHGCSVLGGSVSLAHKRARNLEEAAQLTFRALLLGRRDVPECPPELLAGIQKYIA